MEQESKYEEVKSNFDKEGYPKEKVVFQEEVKLLGVVKGQEFIVKTDGDGYKFINIGKINLYLTEYRNSTGVYKRYKLK